MLLVYVHKRTPRANYTINVVMRDILHTECAITTDAELFERHGGPRLCYADRPAGNADSHAEALPYPYLKAAKLLFETNITEQEPRYMEYEGQPALFPTFGRYTELPFDPLAAIFYMLSRYEEYLPHKMDEHGRFPATESTAYRHGFLQKAVVERWALMVKTVIMKHYPEADFGSRRYSFVQTVDIDAAYCYKHKGAFRTVMGILRDGVQRHDPEEVKRRMRVIRGEEEDPYDTFEYIIRQNQRRGGHSNLIFFALLGDYGIYDKPASFHNDDFRQLLQHLGDYSKVGIHGSYYSAEEPERLGREMDRLSDILHRPIVRNRFHFLHFTLPGGYQCLMQNGIAHDYSMGYAEMPGFRCGSCSTVPYYDLYNEQESDLKIHPFMVMDTTLHTHLGLTCEEAAEQCRSLIDEVRSLDGTFTCIFHNQNLCEDFGWEGWRRVYEETLDYGNNINDTKQ